MRVAKLKVRIATLTILAGMASSCQTAQKPVALLPATSAPALTTAAAAPVPASPQARPATPQATAKPPQVPAEAPAETKAQTPSSPRNPDPVADLVAQGEKDYQAGLEAYHAGQTNAAKQDFDNPFTAFLGSSLDARSDDRLEKEFDRIVEGVNHLDLGALGFASDSEAQK